MDQQWYESTTIQGSLISFLDLLVLLFHLQIGNDLITNLVVAVFGLIGAVMTVWGRIRASGAIKVGSKIL